MPTKLKKAKLDTVDFRNAIRRKRGESVVQVSFRAKQRTLERLAKERLLHAIAEFRELFEEFEQELPTGVAARTLENVVARNLASHHIVFLMLDKKTVNKQKSNAKLLELLHGAVSK